MSDVFKGIFNGVTFLIESEQTRYLPTHVAEHLAKQLRNFMTKEKIEFDATKILTEEFQTTESEKKLTFKEEMDKHEEDFKERQLKIKKERESKIEKAKEILEKEKLKKKEDV